MNKILITRPIDDAKTLAQELSSIGFESFIEPMIEIKTTLSQNDKLNNLIKNTKQLYIITTSTNGVRALAKLSQLRNIPLLTIGQASYDEAEKLGYKNITLANPEYGGDVVGLSQYICENYSTTENNLLHITGQMVAGNLVEYLQSKNFNIQSLTIYNAKPSEELSEELISYIKEEKITAITFYSPRTVKIFKELIIKHKLQQDITNISCFCLSNNVAIEAKKLPFKSIYTAKNPTQNSMLSLLKENQ